MNKSIQKSFFLSGRDFNQFVFVAMSAFGYKLRSFIQGRIWVGPQDGQFFCQTQLAVHRAAAVAYGLALQTIYKRFCKLLYGLALLVGECFSLY